MFARATTFEGTPEQIEEGIAIFEAEVIPWLRDATGFRGWIALVDRERGQGLGISFWTSEETMRDATASGAALRDEVAEAVGALLRSERFYEVAHADVLRFAAGESD
jgi:hypothetical protein